MSTTSYPGDDIVGDPFIELTHSTEVAAPPAEVWPWLVQLGYHRGGWYIDTWWDKFAQDHFWPRLVPKEDRGEYRPPADRVHREFQTLQVGDTIPDGPPGTAYYSVVGLEENRFLLLHSTSHFKYLAPGFLRGTRWEPHGEFSWVFVLEETAVSKTLVTSRWRGKGSPPAVMAVWKPVIVIADYLHQKEILKGLRRRVEREPTIQTGS